MRTIAVLLVLLFQFGFSSPAQITFQKTYGDSTVNDNGQSIVQTKDGGYAIAGTQYSTGNHFRFLFLIKTNANGDTIWTRLINESFNDYSAAALQQTFDGGLIITGINGNASLSNPYLLKTDSAGNILWNKSYEIAGLEHTYSVDQTADSGYIIAGYMYNGNNLIYLIRTNSVGDTLWTKAYGETGYNAAVYSVSQTTDGGFIATGTLQNTSTQDVDVCLFKTDGAGNILWTKTFGDIGYEYGQQVQQMDDGGFIIAATTYSFGAGLADFYLIKTDSSGNLLWSKTYGGTSDDRSESVVQTFDGGYLISGESASFSFGNFDVYMIKTNSLGDTLWTKTVNGLQNNEGYSLAQTADSGFAIAGTYLNAQSNNDIFLLKTDSHGNMNCTERSSATIVTAPSTQVNNHQLNIFATGTQVLSPSVIVSSGTSVETFCSSVNVDEIYSENSISVFPNPAGNQFTVFSPQSSVNAIEVYDAISQKKITIAAFDRGLQTVDCGLFSSGIYFVKVKSEKGMVVKKLVKQ